MPEKHVYIYISLKKGKVDRLEVYATLNKLHDCENLKIGNKSLTLNMMYHMVTKIKSIETDEFIIRKRTILTTKRK